MARRTTKWENEAERRLLELYKQGVTAAEIAEIINKEFNYSLTENAVYKKIQNEKLKFKSYSCEGITHSIVRTPDEMRLYFVSDAHIGGGVRLSEFKGFLKRIEEDDKARAVVLGDVLQSETVSSKGSPFKKDPKKDLDDLIELLSPISSKILAVVSGNHENRVEKLTGINPLRDVVCPLLSIPYCQSSIYLTMMSARYTLTLYAIHGYSFARTYGAKANALTSLLQVAEADVYATAHSHTPMIIPTSRWYVVNKRPVLKQKLFINAPSFQAYSGYSVEKGYAPSSKMVPVVSVSDGIEAYLIS